MKQKKHIQIKQILIGIGIIFSLFITCWSVFTYLERFALCETVQKLDQKFDKGMEMMEKKNDRMINYFDYKFLTAELKVVEERIYSKEKEIANNPKDLVKKAELEALKRQREQILRDMEDAKKAMKEVK